MGVYPERLKYAIIKPVLRKSGGGDRNDQLQDNICSN
jgi:hypothetical protein